MNVWVIFIFDDNFFLILRTSLYKPFVLKKIFFSLKLFLMETWGTKDFSHLKRPDIGSNIPGLVNDELCFATTDVTYRLVRPDEVPEHLRDYESTSVDENVPGLDKVPVIDVYGVTKTTREENKRSVEGCNSVRTSVYGYRPRFFVSTHVPKGSTSEDMAYRVKHRLQMLMMGLEPDTQDPTQQEYNRLYWKHYANLLPGESGNRSACLPVDSPVHEMFKPYVVNIRVISARSIYGYHPKDKNFLEIVLLSPKMVTKARALFQGTDYMRFRKAEHGYSVKTYESNLEFVNRFTVDKNIKGMHWLKVKWERDTRAGIDIANQCLSDYPIMKNQDLKAEIEREVFQETTYEEAIIARRMEIRYGIKQNASTCQIEIDVHESSITGVPKEGNNENLLPTLRALSLDAEMANSVVGMFCNPTNPGDKVFLVCFVAYELTKAKTPIEASVFVLGGFGKDIGNVAPKWGIKRENTRIYSYKTEEALFEGMRNYILHFDPDILTGYNIIGFDLPYFHHRADFLKLSPEQWSLYSRDATNPVRLKSCTFQSNAYGRKDSEVPMCFGRNIVDVQDTVMRDYTCRFDSFKLDDVGRNILGERKRPVPFWKITWLYINGYVGILIKYCLIDAMLPPNIAEKKGHDVLYVEMARMYGVTMTDLLLRGQQKRIYSFLLSFCYNIMKNGEPYYLIPYNLFIKNENYAGNRKSNAGRTSSQFKGATVVEPNRGYYTNPVSTLDFASLYPSIMLAHNLCYSTLMRPDIRRRGKAGVTHYVSPSGDAFVYASKQVGILCRILTLILAARKASKYAMFKAEKGSAEEAMYNAKQIAEKQCANSVYGYTSAHMQPCLAIARTVTAYGRKYIQKTREFVTNMPMLSDPSKYPLPKNCRYKIDKMTKKRIYYPYDVIYGDSVTGDTPVLVRDYDMCNDFEPTVRFVRIDQLVRNKENYASRKDGKEQIVYDYTRREVWSDTGWTRIKRVIRHKVNKPMWRILTHTGVVDATEDHSLLNTNGEEVTPADVTVGYDLLHASPKNSIPTKSPSFSVKEAFVMGVFFVRGTCESYHYDYGTKNTWEIYKLDKELLLRCQECLPFTTKILDTKKPSGLYKLVIDEDYKNGYIKDVVDKYRNLFYNFNKQKIVPNEILCAPTEWLQAFFDGFCAGATSREDPYKIYDLKGKVSVAGLFLIAERLGWKASLNNRMTKPDIFRVTLTKNEQKKSRTTIKKIWRLPDTEQMVYDLETESHHFHVGPGDMVVHNTDSVMILNTYLTRKDIVEGNRVSQLINEKCNTSGLYPKPVKLEWEKTYCPYLLVKKKKYAGLYWTEMKVRDTTTKEIIKVPIPSHVDAKGLMSVRRDNAPVERNVVKKVQDILMGFCSGDHKVSLPGVETIPTDGSKPQPVKVAVVQDPDPKLAENVIKEWIQAMYNGEIPLDEFIITKALTRREEDYVNIPPQVKVNQDIRARAPGTEYPLGARIPYIVGETGERTSTLNSQDPMWMAENGIQPCLSFYIDRLKKPLVQLMAPVLYREQFFESYKTEEGAIIDAFYEEDDNEDDEEEIPDEEYGIVDYLKTEGDDDEKLNQSFGPSHKKTTFVQKKSTNLGAASAPSRSNGQKVITLTDIISNSKKHFYGESALIKKTHDRLFLEGIKIRVRSGNVSKKLFTQLKNPKAKPTGIFKFMSIPPEKIEEFERDFEEINVYREYRQWRKKVNMVKGLKRDEYLHIDPDTSMTEEDSTLKGFTRSETIFEDIADPKLGCIREIEYGWGKRFHSFMKSRNAHSETSTEKEVQYSINYVSVKTENKNKRRKKYTRDEMLFKGLESIKPEQLVVKKKQRSV